MEKAISESARLALVFLGVWIAGASTPSALVAARPQETQWTQFRGTSGTGIGDLESQPAVEIDLAAQTVWRTEVPGAGWSSPVFDGTLIWLTTSISTKADPEDVKKKLADKEFAQIKTVVKTVELRAIAIDRVSGKLVHDKLLRTVNEPEPTHPMNSHASPTCAVAAGKVVCHFGSYGTWCLDAQTAAPIWEAKYAVDHSVGPGSSPVIVDGKAILVCDGIDRQFIAAVDLESGEQAWKTDRPPMNAQSGEFKKAYSTPLLIEAAGKSQLVIPGAIWIAAYAPATGEEIWRVKHGDGFSVTPMACFESKLVIFSTGFSSQKDLVAIDPNGTGDVTDSHIKWRTRRVAPTMPSLIADNGRIYSLNEKGVLACLDAETGEILNRIRVGGGFSSSPLLAGGNLYLSDRQGLMTVVRCKPSLDTVGKTQFDGSIMASPIMDGNDLIVRTSKALIRIKPTP